MERAYVYGAGAPSLSDTQWSVLFRLAVTDRLMTKAEVFANGRTMESLIEKGLVERALSNQHPPEFYVTRRGLVALVNHFGAAGYAAVGPRTLRACPG
jgi:hypothetical protein